MACTKTSRTRSIADFVVLTLVITAVCLACGLVIRSLTSASGRTGEPVPLMNLSGQRGSLGAPGTELGLELDAWTAAVAEADPGSDEAGAAEVREIGETPTFNGRPLRKVREMTMLVTAYSPDRRSCGIWADGMTASGYSVWTNGMKLVAADTKVLPFGSLVSIPGYHGGRPVPVLDRGGKIKGKRLDVLYPTHEIARQWGAQRLTVTIWDYAD